MTDQPAPHTLRKMFFTGMLFLIPIGITIWILNILIIKTQGYARPLVVRSLSIIDPSGLMKTPDWLVTGVSLILVILFILLIGWLANFYLGKKLLALVDLVMLRLPLVRSIYGGSKQIIQAFSLQRSSGSFKKVVLFEYPRTNSWSLGLVTNENLQQNEAIFGKTLVAVFMPSTPNPTTGFLMYLHPKDLYLVDLEVDEAVKLIVSGGMVVPEKQLKKPKTLEQAAEAPSAPVLSSTPNGMKT